MSESKAFFYGRVGNQSQLEAGKKAWNPGFLPTKTELDRYECRHGMGYTKFDSAKDGLSVKMNFFVPVGENCEIHDLVLTNESSESKTVHVYGVMEWCLTRCRHMPACPM